MPEQPLSERSKQLRRDILTLGMQNGAYHYGGSFSAVEIIAALYDKVAKQEDRIIISKGHAWWAQAVILRERGCRPALTGHPGRDEQNGIVCNTGSLGHGMPMAVGMAFARKMFNQPGHIYVVIGDGEAQEGTFWESLLLGRRFELGNLTVVIDNNNIQGSGRTPDILSFINAVIPMGHALNWAVENVDGHNIPHLVYALKYRSHKPNLIVAHTVKGKGVSFMENDPSWHARWPNPTELAKAMKELE